MSLIRKLREVRKAPLFRFVYNHRPFSVQKHIGRKNSYKNKGLIKKSRIKILGTGNEILIGENSRLLNVEIFIKGNNNKLILKGDNYIDGGCFHIEDNNGKITLGKVCNVFGKTQFAAIEGCSIEVGNDCAFSGNSQIRTGDSHSIVVANTNERINPSKNIVIHDHVWCGNSVMILKGVSIPEHSIVGAGSLVTKSFETKNVVIAGSPAKVIKENVDWQGARI